MNLELVRKILGAMEREGVRYLVIGAVAINMLGLARATEDLDLFISDATDNIERLKAALRSVFDDPAIDEISAADLQGEYPAVQYVPPAGDLHVDILTRLGDAFRFEDLVSQRMDIGGITASVATPETLYRMKKGTLRLKDRADAELLRRRFGLEED
jgi:predicted nucleotidyltransferase